ncbi:MAG: hypothetical protein K8I30_19515, partial [Anaerolineae bacterium]|nr:hypothetical protein [Anaerolineae bacterium]
MFKRSTLIGLLLVVLMSGIVFSLSLVSVGAQDATVAPTATPIVAEIGTGGTHISFWNGLTGS